MSGQPPLISIRFKNWRSLRDVTINLTPITVFVGANSSGKTNIFDAFRFLRDAEPERAIEAAYQWRIRDKVRTMNVSDDERVEVEISYTPHDHKRPVIRQTNVTFGTGRIMFAGHEGHTSGSFSDDIAFDKTSEYVAQRWQLLGENFMPLTSIPSDSDPGSAYLIEPSARNVPFMLYFMQQTQAKIYNELQEDLRWLLSHVDKTAAEQDNIETRLVVRETDHNGEKALTISAGTSRLIAMLTAYYALDMRTPEMPGLIVIEEPDTALHPLLLGRFVELLRTYVDNDNPRQFILTTHNPMFLNYFQPEEVRIVERDEHGETTVSPIDMDVANVWFKETGAYNLGNLWTTRLLGGVP